MALLADAPWWVKVFAYMLLYIGFPVAMTVLLFGVVIGYIPSPMLTTDASLKEHREETRKVITLLEGQGKTMRQICRNVSTNKIEQLACDQ